MMPSGCCERTSSSDAVHGNTTEKTFCSRIRRAINCVYWEPKSRMTIEDVSTYLVYVVRANLRTMRRFPEFNKNPLPDHGQKRRRHQIKHRDRSPPQVQPQPRQAKQNRNG